MDDWREQRIARNEASFRAINERLERDVRQVPHNPELLEFICECGDRTCESHVELTLTEYEAVREDSRHFAVVPGHLFPETERVLQENERYQLIEKFGGAVPVTDATDERVPGHAGRRAVPGP